MIILLRGAAFSQAALRGMYINHFDNILGNTDNENQLFKYAADSSYNYFALYDLNSVDMSVQSEADKLALFIKRARLMYGVQYIGAVAETYADFQNKIVPFNNSRTDVNERFNVFNLEFEFWTTSSVSPGNSIM